MKLSQKPKPKKALIYCRVSSTRQKDEANGLESQEHRCRQYAAMHSYDVERVFPDDVTGGGDFIKRKGMVALLKHLDAHPEHDYVVIFDDLKRLARDRDAHFQLRHAFRLRGADVECPNYRFDDTPEGEFVETVFAAQGQLERQQGRRQTIQKMRARVENGYFVFPPPRGYTFQKIKGGGRILCPNEHAPPIREALEGFASGRFQSPTEVKRFLEAQPSFPKNIHGEIWLRTVIGMLKQPLYAGYMHVKKWNIHLYPAKHEALISFTTWQRIQERLEGVSNAPARKDLREDFPLRGFVECGGCGSPLTAGWSKGRKKHYAYYNCQQKGCPDYKKSIRKADIEGAFETLLTEMQPAPALFEALWAMLSKAWDRHRTGADERKAGARAEVTKIEHKIAKLTDRLIATDTPSVIQAYETQIKKLEHAKIVLAEKAAQTTIPRADLGQAYRTAMQLLANPLKIWASDALETKRMLLRLAFPERLAYCRNEGYRTAGIAEPFRLIRELSDPKLPMVPHR